MDALGGERSNENNKQDKSRDQGISGGGGRGAAAICGRLQGPWLRWGATGGGRERPPDRTNLIFGEVA